ncbi:MAG: hypothetical protein A2161_03710 [Candidatus Schekmanbacteria bacterium RBG_13_48_7]|uniref:Lipid A biosynthesis acyltransferase n=1 Tax=Candidatus Schekmanbacteria bacterium RBG_13_48_7 TaxID=1817878 RepID=A0A1F7RXC4_9BACT|nr:MAG: hypothetical protein A2161_03710 [Candidatus Schekmanbacteria bacterium RBG_13_48_7]
MSLKNFVKNIYHRGIYTAALFFSKIGGTLSYSQSQAMGKILGRITYYAMKNEREKTVTHIKQALGNGITDCEAKHLGKLCFEHLGMSLFEVFQLPNFHGSNIHEYITSEGLENIVEIQKQNKGALLVTGHIGNWELLGAFLARCGVSFTVIARENSNPYLNELLAKHRKIAGFNTIFREGISTVKESLRILHNGGFLGMLVDQHTRVESVIAPFFGIPAYTPVGPFSLARKTGVPLIFTTIHRLSNGKHCATFSKPLILKHTDDKSGDLTESAVLINRLYEETIRKHPEQWVWMHRRWRN